MSPGMSEDAYVAYAPLNALKPFADDVWTVDGPEIGMRWLGLTIPFPTRMTIVRLDGGVVWIHSPTAWNRDLAEAIGALGPVQHLVAPNTLHHSYLPDWQAGFPRARSYGLPNLARKARHRIAVDEVLGRQPPVSWGDAFAQCLVCGSLLTEVAFFHRVSRTLILTDLIENFEPARVRNRILRRMIKVFGVADPDGKAPIDMQLSFIGYRRQVRAAVEQMIAWSPLRIVIAHGRCYDANAVPELRRAFRWVL